MSSLELAVRLESEAAAQFERAVWFDEPKNAAGQSQFVVMRWLAAPEIRQAIVAQCPIGCVPIQTRQVSRPRCKIEENIGHRLRVALTPVAGAASGMVLAYTVLTDDGNGVSDGEIEFVFADTAKLAGMVA